MIKFFRKIRYNLIEKNKTEKYLKYAIGEIVLVVIGILIALSINNWNESRKENNLEQSYYCKLLEDIEQDIQQIQSQIGQSEKRLDEANEMLSLLQMKNPPIESVLKRNHGAISLITYTFRPSIAAYEDLKSSGNLKILRDSEVKRRVTEYYSMIDGMIDVMDTNADGAVALFYAKSDYAESGWHYLDFVKTGIDTSKVNFNQLMPESFDLEKFRKKMTSDAIFYVGANSRIKYLYEAVLPNMERMQEVLKNKCN
jgi:hypothetical protein